jgi:hypothetical protein
MTYDNNKPMPTNNIPLSTFVNNDDDSDSDSDIETQVPPTHVVAQQVDPVSYFEEIERRS